MSRLETLSTELAAKLKRATIAKQRAAGLVAADFAVYHAKVDEAVINDALITLRSGTDLLPEKKAQLEDLVARLDEEYFDLQEAAEEGRSTTDEYLRVFGQARAVASVLYAFKDDPFEAATEAIYEAAAVTDAPTSLFSAVESVLQ